MYFEELTLFMVFGNAYNYRQKIESILFLLLPPQRWWKYCFLSFLILSLLDCGHDILKITGWIRMKISGMFGIVAGTNWLDFVIDPVPDKHCELFLRLFFPNI